MSVDSITTGKSCFGGAKKKIKKKSTSKKRTAKKSTSKKSSKSKSTAKKSKSKSKSKTKRSKTKKGKKRRTLLGNNSREMQRQLRELHAIEKEILDRRNIEEQIYKEQMQENLKHEQQIRLQMRKPTPFIKASSRKASSRKTPKRENITLSVREPSVREQDILNTEDILNTIEKSPELSYEGDLSYRD